MAIRRKWPIEQLKNGQSSNWPVARLAIRCRRRPCQRRRVAVRELPADGVSPDGPFGVRFHAAAAHAPLALEAGQVGRGPSLVVPQVRALNPRPPRALPLHTARPARCVGGSGDGGGSPLVHHRSPPDEVVLRVVVDGREVASPPPLLGGVGTVARLPALALVPAKGGLDSVLQNSLTRSRTSLSEVIPASSPSPAWA